MPRDREQPGPTSGWDETGDLLESGGRTSGLSRWGIAAALLVVTLAVGVPRALDWQRHRREHAARVAADNARRQADAERLAAERAAAADRVALVVVRLRPHVQPPPDARADDPETAQVELTFTLSNLLGELRLHDVTFTPGDLPAMPLSHPDVIPANGEADLSATIRVPCAEVLGLDDTGETRLSATVTPESGRRRAVDSLLRHRSLPLSSALRDSCGLQSPWEAAKAVATFVPSARDRLTYDIAVRNVSRRPLVVEQLARSGMTVTSSVPLPLVVAPGSEAKLRATLRIARCDAIGISRSGNIDNLDLLVQLAVTGVAHESAEVVAAFADEDIRYRESKQRLLTAQCPHQVHQ
jgi:hypothetical protein